MDFKKTQKGELLEQIKLARLSDTPIVYIPTPQMELIDDIMYSEECDNSIIPRLWIDGNDDNKIIELKGRSVSPPKKEGKTNVGFISYLDNYYYLKDNASLPEIKGYPMLFVSFEKDWKNPNLTARLLQFVKQYLGIKIGDKYLDPQKTALTRKSLYIVVTPSYENIPEQLTPYVRTIFVDPVGDEEIESIIGDTMRSMQLNPELITQREQLFTLMKVSFRGMSTLKIKSLMLQMIRSGIIDDHFIHESVVISAIHEAKKEILANCPGLKWEKTGSVQAAGLDNILAWLDEHAVLFQDPKAAAERHIDIPNGILITGIPGSGKSLMAKTAAYRLGMPLISLNMGMLRGSLMGESERNLENALNTAESMAPCVLWIDEIEKAMSGSSGNGASDSGLGERMFGTFLTWMQEKTSACFVFATSNDITHLPSELFRSERFDRKFFTYMPMTSECAMIFSSIIRTQNKEYWSELHRYGSAKMREMPRYLFDTELEECSVWIDILNKACTDRPEDCYLKNQNGRYLWNSGKKPGNKLLSGADISSIIKEAKFRAMRKVEAENKDSADDLLDMWEKSVYGKELFISTVIEVIRGFKPYGETNLPNLAKSFRSLFQNQFEPASGNFILDFNDFDETELCYTPHEPVDEGQCPNSSESYDRVLYHTLVGAINHYLPILEKKGEL